MLFVAIIFIGYLIAIKKIFFAVALVMGYISATNAWVETQVRTNIAASYANSKLGILSSLGGLTSWICPIAAAYFYSDSTYDKTFWDGLLFILCVFFGGTVIAGLVKSRYVRYMISPFVLIINPVLTYLAYVISVQ